MPRKIGVGIIIGLVVGISAISCVGIETAMPTPQPAASTAPAKPTAQVASTPVPTTPAPAATATPVASPTTVEAIPTPMATTVVATPTPAATATIPANAAPRVRLTVDGQPVRLEGEPKAELVRSSVPNIGTVDTILIEAGQVGDQSKNGYGVQLVLQSAPNRSNLGEGFALNDIQAATLTVWRDGQHSFVSTNRVPPQPVQSLELASTRGQLAGSYENTVDRGAGRFPARIEFNLPFPALTENKPADPEAPVPKG